VSVLIHGAEVRDSRTGNRGAELMLREVARRATAAGYNQQVLIGRVSPDTRRSIGLGQLIGGPKFHWLPSVRIPKRASTASGLATDENLDAVLDASGFALGDQWGGHVAGWLARKYEHWNAKGIPVVLLPQAFGPFETPEVRASAARALAAATQIWARDAISYRAVMSLVGEKASSKVSICPDITIADALVSDRSVEKAPRLVVIPNANILRGPDDRSHAYIRTLEQAVAWARGRGLEVVGLLHEGAGDASLLRDLSNSTGIRLMLDLSAPAVKQYLGSSQLVLSARYHGVVSALSCGVPVAVHSWSHKYQALLDDFQRPDWLADPFNPDDTIRALELCRDAKGVTDALLAQQRMLAAHVDAMWERVWSVVE
jgi:polysaccharide pyruvyl transferase WcaK-like protein